MNPLRSFFLGLGQLVDIWPKVENPRPRSDLDALRGDTARIGEDMRRAMGREKSPRP